MRRFLISRMRSDPEPSVRERSRTRVSESYVAAVARASEEPSCDRSSTSFRIAALVAGSGDDWAKVHGVAAVARRANVMSALRRGANLRAEAGARIVRFLLVERDLPGGRTRP